MVGKVTEPADHRHSQIGLNHNLRRVGRIGTPIGRKWSLQQLCGEVAHSRWRQTVGRILCNAEPSECRCRCLTSRAIGQRCRCFNPETVRRPAASTRAVGPLRSRLGLDGSVGGIARRRGRHGAWHATQRKPRDPRGRSLDKLPPPARQPAGSGRPWTFVTGTPRPIGPCACMGSLVFDTSRSHCGRSALGTGPRRTISRESPNS
jgi:hypothetical protein